MSNLEKSRASKDLFNFFFSFSQLNDEKNRIEYEYKQKNEHLTKQNNDNMRDLHSLQDAFNEK